MIRLSFFNFKTVIEIIFNTAIKTKETDFHLSSQYQTI